jgi:hypothetical protein
LIGRRGIRFIEQICEELPYKFAFSSFNGILKLQYWSFCDICGGHLQGMIQLENLFAEILV